MTKRNNRLLAMLKVSLYVELVEKKQFGIILNYAENTK